MAASATAEQAQAIIEDQSLVEEVNHGYKLSLDLEYELIHKAMSCLVARMANSTITTPNYHKHIGLGLETPLGVVFAAVYEDESCLSSLICAQSMISFWPPLPPPPCPHPHPTFLLHSHM